MPHVALLLALALSGGLACGVVIDANPGFLPSVLALGWAASVVAFLRGWPRALLAAVVVAIFSAGWLLGAHAIERAMHPSLRSVLEQRLGGFALEGVAVRHDEPIVIEGRLSQDASPGPTGVLLRVEVERISSRIFSIKARGGVSLSVGGEQQAFHLKEWRRGRLIRAPALLRRPARFMNERRPRPRASAREARNRPGRQRQECRAR